MNSRHNVTRREFLEWSAGAVAQTALSASRNTLAFDSSQSREELMGHRFVTHISVISVDGIEVTRTQGIGGDVSSSNTPERVQARREAFRIGSPSGSMTWGLSWRALNDDRQQFRDIRRLLAKFHDQFGDEITFFVGGYFAPMYDTRENVNRDIADAMKLVSRIVGGGYRPQSIIAGFLAADNQQYLAEHEGIHVCQGQIWSQHGIDHGDGDGGISYPYYPSREHYLKPAQGKADFIDCVCLDGWTCDFLAARHEGVSTDYNSRMGCGPIETVNNLGRDRGRKELIDTTALHFDDGFRRNGFAWVTAIWELSLPPDLNGDLTYWLHEIDRRWPGTKVVTEGQFGMAWRDHYKNNDAIDYRFVQKGTGAPGSETNLEMSWYMNKDFRLAFLKELGQGEAQKMVIDFTRYDWHASEPRTIQRDWSLMNVLNQKGTRLQDKPVAFSRLAGNNRDLILRRYPHLENS
jgi:Domain of Unknown Function with PDB structure (DUF3863)/Domain of Unknown Function with PDB structure (DUF3864)